MPADPVRDSAIDVLLRIFERGAFIELAIDRKLRRRDLSERGARFMAQLVYGTVRHRTLCEYVLKPVLRQPLEQLPAPIQMILRMGVFQALFCNQVTFPAMVHTSVDLAKKRGHVGTAKLVNAVLKRCPEQLDDVELPDKDRDLDAFLSVRYSMPPWLVARFRQQFSDEEAERFIAACAEEAPTRIRVNTLRTKTDALRNRLEQTGTMVGKHTVIPEELTLESGPPAAKSKLFQQGNFMVQDAASMLAAHLVEPKADEWVLDMCAAPGGKATHLAALAQDEGVVVAMDRHARKAGLITDNAERLGLGSVDVVCADGLAAPFGRHFDRVLLDAPCSGLGTLRRHPDLKWRITETEITEKAALQRDLLRSAIELCENQGVVVYSVCTVTDEETQGVVEAILSEGRVELEDGSEWLNEWKIRTGTYRTLPNTGGLDGFFLTRLRKRS